MFTKVIRTLAFLISLLVFLTSLGALFNSYLNQGPAILTLCGLMLPVTLIISLLLLIFWLTMRSFWALLPVATLLLSYTFIAAVFQPKGGHSEKVEATLLPLKLCSYNIQGVRYGQADLTLRLLADFVEQSNIDILCLQEMDEGLKAFTDSLLATKTGLRYSVTAPGSQPGFALSVHSRFPLVNATDIQFKQTGNHALQVDLFAYGDTLRLYNIHLQTTHYNQHKHGLKPNDWVWNLGDEQSRAGQLINSLQTNTTKRNNQTAVLMASIRASPIPVIACGDFNAHPASYTYTAFRQVLEDGFRTAGKGYEYTYRYLGNLLRIDYFFHDKALKGLSYASHELDFSDHKAVVFTLSCANRSD